MPKTSKTGEHKDDRSSITTANMNLDAKIDALFKMMQDNAATMESMNTELKEMRVVFTTALSRLPGGSGSSLQESPEVRIEVERGVGSGKESGFVGMEEEKVEKEGALEDEEAEPSGSSLQESPEVRIEVERGIGSGKESGFVGMEEEKKEKEGALEDEEAEPVSGNKRVRFNLVNQADEEGNGGGRGGDSDNVNGSNSRVSEESIEECELGAVKDLRHARKRRCTEKVVSYDEAELFGDVGLRKSNKRAGKATKRTSNDDSGCRVGKKASGKLQKKVNQDKGVEIGEGETSSTYSLGEQ